jgi:choline dehydrogenase-like flavoprotein
VNCAAWIAEETAADDPFVALHRLIDGPREHPLRDARSIISSGPLIVRGVRARLNHERVMPKIQRLGFVIASEQVPDPDSRISLSERRDRLGLPISRIDWRIAPQELASQAVLATAIAREFQRLGMPRAQLADWVAPGRHEQAVMEDGMHPMGATRMSDDPRRGVVDADCRVHGVPGLYVAGSSVFPTGGHANPTLMLVGLAIRLADHLGEQLRQSSVLPSEPHVVKSESPGS